MVLALLAIRASQLLRGVVQDMVLERARADRARFVGHVRRLLVSVPDARSVLRTKVSHPGKSSYFVVSAGDRTCPGGRSTKTERGR